MLTKSEIIFKRKELKPELQREFVLKEIGLFGSLSENTKNEESDIDLLVEFEKPIGWKFFSLEIYLQKKLIKKLTL
jgi:hypothetical protein